MVNELKIGIIGGSGMEDPAFIKDYSSQMVSTPYGNPSSEMVIGKIADFPVAILSRHGLGHSINPTNVNYRANIWALKDHGCTHILSTTACGSLREDIKPGDFVFPDQFIDRTSRRISTFYDDSHVQHVPMGSPFCQKTRMALQKQAKELGLKFHLNRTVVTIEGPRFSTKAESNLFRSWGCDIINMSTIPEVILARECGLCYQSIGMSTDYDCWRENEEDVTMEMIFSVMAGNAENVKRLIIDTIPTLSIFDCKCQSFYNNLKQEEAKNS